MNRIVLKLSGEALGGEKGIGVDPVVAKALAQEIKEAYELKTHRISIVCGGGNFFRGRDAKELGVDRVECDYMGMIGTVMNAIYLKNALIQAGVKTKVISCLEIPTAVETYTVSGANEYLDDDNVVIFAGGTGRPYFSTDTATLLRAVDINANLVLMGKNGVDGVYSADPNVDKNAVKYDILSHRDILKENLNVMDLTAASIADEHNIDIIVFDISAKGAIKKALQGEKIGTLVRKEK